MSVWRTISVLAGLSFAVLACSGESDGAAEDDGAATPGPSAESGVDANAAPAPGASAPRATAEPAADTQTEARPLATGAFVTFFDEASGMSFEAVHDAEREIVYFDAERGAMVSAATGDAVSGWSTSGTDLLRNGRGGAFRVRFGTESGERRAFFTETVAGTICNLEIAAPELLSIFATRELPPQ